MSPRGRRHRRRNGSGGDGSDGSSDSSRRGRSRRPRQRSSSESSQSGSDPTGLPSLDSDSSDSDSENDSFKTPKKQLRPRSNLTSRTRGSRRSITLRKLGIEENKLDSRFLKNLEAAKACMKDAAFPANAEQLTAFLERLSKAMLIMYKCDGGADRFSNILTKILEGKLALDEGDQRTAPFNKTLSRLLLCGISTAHVSASKYSEESDPAAIYLACLRKSDQTSQEHLSKAVSRAIALQITDGDIEYYISRVTDIVRQVRINPGEELSQLLLSTVQARLAPYPYALGQWMKVARDAKKRKESFRSVLKAFTTRCQDRMIPLFPPTAQRTLARAISD